MELSQALVKRFILFDCFVKLKKEVKIMAGELESLFAITYFGIPALAVLWNYSSLPKIDWKYLVGGTLLLLTGAAVNALTSPVEALGAGTQAVFAQVGAIVAIIGLIFIIVGALQNLSMKMK